jgi:predicted transglutaminase-like cysteine proteinase/thiol-disulfide isomerase/thioredoxin
MPRTRFARLALFLVCLLAWGSGFASAERKAISFQFIDLDGRQIRLADLRGKWVLVSFWAYWCPLCRIGIPSLNNLNQREDFVVIGVSLDYGGDVEKVKDAVAQHGMKYHAQVAGGSRRDADSPFRQVGPVDFFPSAYLYDPTGEIVMFIPGQLRKGQLLAFMDAWRSGKGTADLKPVYAMDLTRFEAALTQRHGNAGTRTFRQWNKLRDELKSADTDTKLARVNDYVNQRVRLGSDSAAWGKANHWATPAETLGAGQGDSQDIATAKYFTLLSLDIPPERLRLVYASLRRDKPAGKAPVHMVLAYYPGPSQDPLILDNHDGSLRPASQRPDLQPVFSFNNLHMPPATADSPHGQAAWQQVLQRARAEGFE